MVRHWFRKPAGEIPCRFESCTLRAENHYQGGYYSTNTMGIFQKKASEPTPKELIQQVKVLQEKLDAVSIELSEFKQKMKNATTKVGLIRFNPFRELGGDQSFCIALLDDNNSGFVITSYYGANYHRVYAKDIVGGNSEYMLSEEEKQAIVEALQKESAKKKGEK